MDKLFSTDISNKVLGDKKYINTVFRSLCEDNTQNKRTRKKFESWFARVPHHKSKDIIQRFTNHNDNVHWSAFWEMGIADYFASKGFIVRWGKDGEPDLFLRDKTNKREFAVEIRGLYISELEAGVNQALDALCERLNSFNFPVKLDINLIRGEILEKDVVWLESTIVDWLTTLKNPSGKNSKKEIKTEDYHLYIRTLPEIKHENGNIVFSRSIYMDNERDRTKDVIEYIRKKLKQARKYKTFLQENNIPLIVALGNSINFPYQVHIEWALYGKIKIRLELDRTSRNIEHKGTGRDNRGVIAQSRYFSKPEYTRIGGVMYFEKQWNNRFYELSCYLYENYWAVTRISPYDFGCPTFKHIAEGIDGVTFGWIN